MPHKQKTTYNFGVSLPINMVDEIDVKRGYYSRSKWILMALESLSEQIERRKSVQPDLVGRHDQADGRVSTQTRLESAETHEL
jgi:metal-responsive CopG/Arc/MetJ family transcriptional regulator